MSEIKVNKISPRTACGTVTVGDSGDSVSVSAGVPVTVSGDLKSNALKATDGGSIISQSGTTITLGASGDTINLASGATQTGFGKSGAVDWQTTIKTGDFTAVSGEGYFVNTTGGAVTVTLPSSPSAGAIVGVKDYANTADTNAITINRNGSNVDGTAEDPTIANEGGSVILVYADATKGWLVVEAAKKSDLSFPTFMVATGGTVSTIGDFKVHAFTGPGTFSVSSVGTATNGNKVDYMVVGGGGAGGRTGGGGGGGGWRASRLWLCGTGPTVAIACGSTVSASPGSYPITVGAGGAAQDSDNIVNNPGATSTFNSITSAGGGGSASFNGGGGANGGSGGGGNGGTGGTGNTPSVTPAQGKNGGNAPSGGYAGGGGGGAGEVGQATPNPTPANRSLGGDGLYWPTAALCGASPALGEAGGSGPAAGFYFSGGGAGAGVCTEAGSGGLGGGANGGNTGNSPPCAAGTANTGGGGGGRRCTGNNTQGGSGIVIIRYKFQ